MLNRIKSIVAILICLSIIFSLSACKKSPEETSEYSVYYEYNDVPVYVETEGSQDSTSDGKKPQANTNTSSTTSPSMDFNAVKEESSKRAKNLKGRTITYVTFWAESSTSDTRKAIEETEKLLNCKFVHRYMNDYKPLFTSILSGDPIADIVQCKFDECLAMANQGMLIPLNSLSNINLKDGIWNKSAIKETTLKGNSYGLASQLHLRDMIIYNCDMFKQNNWPDLYDLQKKGKLSWDILYNIMDSAVTTSGTEITRYGLVPKYSIPQVASVLLNANGVNVLERQGDGTELKFGMDCNAAINSLNTLTKWKSKAGLLYDTTAFGWDTGREVFYSGKAAMAIVDHQHVKTIINNSDFEFGLIPFPAGPDATNNLYTYLCDTAAFPKGIKNPNDVALFWDVYQKMYYTEDYFSFYTDAATHPSVKATIDSYVEHLNSGNYTHDFARPEGSDGIDLNDFYKQVVNGETTPQAMIQTVKQRITALANDFWN